MEETRVADPDLAARHPPVQWDLIYGMRNGVVHDYFDVDLQVAWAWTPYHPCSDILGTGALCLTQVVGHVLLETLAQKLWFL